MSRARDSAQAHCNLGDALPAAYFTAPRCAGVGNPSADQTVSRSNCARVGPGAAVTPSWTFAGRIFWDSKTGWQTAALFTYTSRTRPRTTTRSVFHSSFALRRAGATSTGWVLRIAGTHGAFLTYNRSSFSQRICTPTSVTC